MKKEQTELAVTPAWLRRTRAQILRRAASLVEDPLMGQVERGLMRAAEELRVGGEQHEAVRTPISRVE